MRWAAQLVKLCWLCCCNLAPAPRCAVRCGFAGCRFLALLKKGAEGIKIGHPLDADVKLGPVVSKVQYDKVDAVVVVAAATALVQAELTIVILTMAFVDVSLTYVRCCCV